MSFKNRGLVGAPIAMASSVFSVRDSGLGGGWGIRREGAYDSVGRVPACPKKSQKKVRMKHQIISKTISGFGFSFDVKNYRVYNYTDTHC